MSPADLELDDLVAAGHDDLRAVMDAMTRNRLGVVLVCGPGRHLEGVVADGDIRRALVDGTLLSAPVAKILNADPVTATSEAEARTRLAESGLAAVPVVDAANTVVAVVTGGPEGRAVRAAAPAPPAPAPGALALIPARGGSVRLPGKNLAPLRGVSLLARAVAAARAADGIGPVVVSTDDPAIAEAARAAGAEVPWLRPAELATAATPTAAVVAHAAAWAATALDPPPEVIVLLEPTAPLRPDGLIDEVLAALAADPGTASAATVAAVPHTLHPDEQLVITGGRVGTLSGGALEERPGRLAQQPTHVVTGQVYATRLEPAQAGLGVLVAPCVPVLRPWSDMIDIDDASDLARAEAALAGRDPLAEVRR